MAVQELSLDTISGIDSGKAGEIVNRKIREAIADIEERGHKIRKPRTVTIKLALWPIDEGEIGTDIACELKLPAHSSGPAKAQIRQTGQGVTAAFDCAEVG